MKGECRKRRIDTYRRIPGKKLIYRKEATLYQVEGGADIITMVELGVTDLFAWFFDP